MVIKHRLSRLVLTVVALFNLSAEAAEWAAEPSVSLSERFNDNFRLTSTDHINTWATIVDPRLSLVRRDELWDLSASARARFERYNQSEFDTTATFLNLAAKRRFERGSWTANASSTNDTTLQNEVLDLDTGLTTIQVDRTRQELRFAGQYMFTEATWLEASVDYSTLDYDNGEQFGLFDYNVLTPELRIVHQLDPKTQIFSTLNRSMVDYDIDTNLEYTSDSLQLGAAYDLSETWNISGSVGGQRTEMSSQQTTAVPRPGFEFLFPFVFDTVTVPQDSVTTGLVYNASLTRGFESGSLSLSGSQSISPSSRGTNTETTSITLKGTRKFSAKLSGDLAVSFLKSSKTDVATTGTDNDRYRVEPALNWHLERDLVLNAGYSYTHIKRGAVTSEEVDSNAVFIGLGYTWPRLAVSR